MKADLCPVCKGSGKYTDPPDPVSISVPMPRPCHGCNGKGWVEVSDNSYPWYPSCPSVWPHYPQYPPWDTRTVIPPLIWYQYTTY